MATGRRRAAETLLREIAKAPDDDDPRSVLADIWQQNGDPRGDLIALQLKGSRSKKIADLIEAHPLAAFDDWEFEFRRGFAEVAKFEGGPGTIARVLDHEDAIAIRELELVLDDDPQAAIDALVSNRRNLTKLTIDIDHFGYRTGEQCPMVTVDWSALPNLRELELRGTSVLSDLQHSRLEVLRAKGCAVMDPTGCGGTKPTVKLPKLHTYELHLEFECDVHIDSVDLEFEAAHTPALRHVKLVGHPYLCQETAGMLGWLAQRPMIAKLKTAHVAQLLDDDDIMEAIEVAPELRHLTELVVHWCRGPADLVRQLRRALPRLSIVDRDVE